MSTDLIDRARSGDAAAFEQLVGPYRREMQVHCYRILGSVADAEDAVQETLTAAWRGLSGFQGRAAIRTWLYRIATSRCLNMLRAASRRPQANVPPLGVEPPEPTRLGEVTWLEPYPDVLLDLPDSAAGPESRYEAHEAISLAFVTALQLLPPRQRAALILRDVLDFSVREVAGLLGTTEQSAASALKRARATLARELPSPERPAQTDSPAERDLLGRLVRAFETGNVDQLVALLTDDVWVTVPPVPLEYRGREPAARFFAAVSFRQGRTYRLLPTRANGQPAFGAYARDPQAKIARADGLLAVTLSGGRICALARFDNSVLPRFGLPGTLPG